jgi:hypothetical protein
VERESAPKSLGGGGANKRMDDHPVRTCLQLCRSSGLGWAKDPELIATDMEVRCATQVCCCHASELISSKVVAGDQASRLMVMRFSAEQHNNMARRLLKLWEQAPIGKRAQIAQRVKTYRALARLSAKRGHDPSLRGPR